MIWFCGDLTGKLRFAILAILTVSTIFLSGCASVSVYDEVETTNIKVNLPKKIYVTDFTTTEESFRVDRNKKATAEFRAKIANDLSNQLTHQLNTMVLPAERAAKLEKLPREHAWAVTGEFLTVHQGSRLLRILVGFGDGKTTLETRVAVYDLSEEYPRPFLSFRTRGGSNFDGGALLPLLTGAPLVAPLSAVSGGVAGLNIDTKRSAREIMAEISAEFQRQHFESKKRPVHPKRGLRPPEIQLPGWVP